ncbi:hypothetical protein L873DRAFT_602165 [Choiromyces venosus 120613-1]|uniref:Uncharacterized protein n=1 Tax=Choiromyces venosus 120613-1 TaxID=1336337 RepID=A0A3N4JTX3_9PEZI|nr:hypothetical protein L873DRAFT_602165 [Choiromyces venosus 120613-1]
MNSNDSPSNQVHSPHHNRTPRSSHHGHSRCQPYPNPTTPAVSVPKLAINNDNPIHTFTLGRLLTSAPTFSSQFINPHTAVGSSSFSPNTSTPTAIADISTNVANHSGSPFINISHSNSAEHSKHSIREFDLTSF